MIKAPISQNVLIFRENHQFFALKMDDIKEVLNATHIRKIPRNHAGFLGFIHHNHSFSLIFDLTFLLFQKKRVQNHSNHIYQKIILLSIRNQNYGLLVENVVKIVQISTQDLETLPITGTNDHLKEHIQTTLKFKGELTYYLEIENIINQFTSRLGNLLPTGSY